LGGYDFFKLLNNDDKKCKKFYIKLVSCLGMYFILMIYNITEFERKVEVQKNHPFGWLRFFKLLNDDDKKC